MDLSQALQCPGAGGSAGESARGRTRPRLDFFRAADAGPVTTTGNGA
ncbi:hypothetical protein ACFWJT_27915 [Streptomyces sp. NPDC127069]